MSRIIYICLKSRTASGGTKMIFRHVEALREMGFDAVVWIKDKDDLPTWLASAAKVIVSEPLRQDDIVVIPEDAPNTLRRAVNWPQRKIVFCQNPFYAALGIGGLTEQEAGAYVDFIACGHNVARYVSRQFPGSRVHVVTAFVDRRLFHPRSAKTKSIACFPRKRPVEAAYIEQGFRRRHARHRDTEWIHIEGRSEHEVANALSTAGLFLSLSRLEGLPLSTLEAMASCCISAGFTGINGREYSTVDNGFWVPEDDCDAAIEALAAAADLLAEGGSSLAVMQQACLGTVASYSREVFCQALEDCWSKLTGAERDAYRL